MESNKSKDTKDKLLDGVYASVLLSAKLNKDSFPKEQHRPRDVYQAIHDEIMLDGNSKTKSCNVLHHVGSTRSAGAHGRVY